MTSDELLIESLSIIQKLIKEELEAEKGQNEASREIRQDYQEVLELLGYIVPKIKGIDSLYEELDEDEFAFIAECLENYQDDFGLYDDDEEADEEDFDSLL